MHPTKASYQRYTQSLTLEAAPGCSGARIRNDEYGNCQNAANDQHQENRPSQKTASRLDRRLYYLFSVFMH
jgi:hypothetical protein